MQMISKKDLHDAEMDTLTKSCSPTIVITASGEVQTHEEAGYSVCQRIGYILDYESPRKHASSIVGWKSFAMKTDILFEWINGQKPHLIKNGIRIQCNTENFVPIVVPGLSTSSSSGSYHSTSSSSSSSSPTATSSDNETREREDRTESDTSPVPVSSFNVDDRTRQPVVGRESNHEPVHQANQKFLKNK